MLNVTLWSKDRACQLDLTLNTLKKYFSDVDKIKLNIIYTHSDDSYRDGYSLVKNYHPEFNWIKETNFKKDTLDSIFNNPFEYQAFLVDDDIFIDYFSLKDPEFLTFFANENISCVSPRLAPYVNYCYTAQGNQPPPEFLNNDCKIWQWRGKPFDWGYPWSVASFHVFRKKDLWQLCNTNFRGANSFEGCFVTNIHFPNKDLMICYNHSKCICSTNNKVQTENNNINANSHPLKDLNDGFLSGKRLDPEINNKKLLNMCHGPLIYKWRE